jgi:hypothetical protein
MLLDDDQWTWLLEQRATRPEAALERLRSRPRRPLLIDGRLFIVAADHTARGMLGVGADPFVMADRRRLLSTCSSPSATRVSTACRQSDVLRSGPARRPGRRWPSGP